MGFFKKAFKRIIRNPFRSITRKPLKYIGGGFLGTQVLEGSRMTNSFLGSKIRGSRDKVEMIPPENLIAKPSTEESQLLYSLYPTAQREIQNARRIESLLYDSPGWTPRPGYIGPPPMTIPGISSSSSLLNTAKQSHQNLYGNVLHTQTQMRNMLNRQFNKAQENISPVYSRLNDAYYNTANKLSTIAQGELPDSYKRAINRTFEEQLGGILDTTAKRGIVNSSVTQRAISDAASRALDMQVKYLPIAAQMARQPLDAAVQYTQPALSAATANYKLASQYAPMATNLAQQQYSFAVSQPLNLFGSLRDIQKDYMSMPYNMWNAMMSARHGVTAQPIVKEGSPGVLPAAGMLGGAALGGLLGGPMGAMVGANIGGYLGNIF